VHRPHTALLLPTSVRLRPRSVDLLLVVAALVVAVVIRADTAAGLLLVADNTALLRAAGPARLAILTARVHLRVADSTALLLEDLLLVVDLLLAAVRKTSPVR
jgi:hypothetical protein